MLGASLFMNFQTSLELSDLHLAIDAQQRAIALMHQTHPDQATVLTDLGHSLWTRFEHLGQLDDLDQCISVQRRAVDLTPEDHPAWASRVEALAISLHSHYACVGDIRELEAAISKKRTVVSVTLEGHLYYPLRLGNLAASLCTRFKCLGEVRDLDEAIATNQLAVRHTPKDDPDRSMWLSNLAVSLRYRFARLGEIDDIENAIAADRLAVNLTPEGHPDRSLRLGNFANSLGSRFERLGELSDLEEAITAHMLAVDLTPENHPDRPGHFSSLARSLRQRFESQGSLQDLEDAIRAGMLAVNLTPESHTDRPSRMLDCASSLRSRFESLGDLHDLEDAIAATEQALCATPDGHPGRLAQLYDLGLSMKAQFVRQQIKAGFDAVYDQFMQAAIQPLGHPTVRMESARECVLLLSNFPEFSSSDLVLDAHSRIIKIFPEIAWLGHSIERRYEESARLGAEMNAAISAFIRLQSRYQAIEWMEAGRSLVWSQMFSLRQPLVDLENAYPDLSAELQTVSSALQQTGSRSQSIPQRTRHLTLSRTSSVQSDAAAPTSLGAPSALERHRKLVLQYQELLKEVRIRPGFANFLQPPKLSSLLPSIEHLDGPVVFINVHSSSCDALALFPNGAIHHIALPDLTESAAHKLRSAWTRFLRSSNARTRGMASVERSIPEHRRSNICGSILWKLWIWIVRPVLQALNLMNEHAPSGKLPHITWCPTGPVTQLPLHAAGIYDLSHASRSQHVYDFVVSSYTPSLAALLRCREAVRPHYRQPEVLVIAQSNTEGCTPLPYTQEEHKRIGSLFPEATFTVLSDQDATRKHVIDAMQQNTWVHLACHGYQDLKNPTQSAFALDDGPLTLFKLMGTIIESSELAFLSARETAVGDENIPEESAHLAAGMLAVGFKGVVATMWSIRDEDAPVIVEAYYRKLIETRASIEGIGYTGAAYALHEAMKVLREHVGERNFVRWAPFVHFGV
ncbi:unnamed protein product [Peniophora sp. CBMAI 1063]|nr:unnamed protein product [Peniophora sp. CBMAI 1063]